MINTALRDQILRLVPQVQTPAQYTGGELNSIVKDHRRVHGKLSRRYCGDGGPKRCRAILLATLADAAAVAPSRVATKCPTDQQPLTCDEIVPITAGAIATPAIPFHNRGTFHQAVEVGGSR